MPIERFGIVRDKISVAKSWSLVKEQEKLHALLVQALNDWAALKTGHLAFEKEAEAEFFRTLSLQAALNLNAMREEEQALIDQLNAEMALPPSLSQSRSLSRLPSQSRNLSLSRCQNQSRSQSSSGNLSR